VLGHSTKKLRLHTLGSSQHFSGLCRRHTCGESFSTQPTSFR